MDGGPKILVFSSLFPNPADPQAGCFIKERMFRVGKYLPLQVVSPVAWFPLQHLLRRWRPYFRRSLAADEFLEGYPVHRPRFLCFPGILKSVDALLMMLSVFPRLWRLRNQYDLIDAHFAYPDGVAACLLGRLLGKRVFITLRGTEIRHAQNRLLRKQLLYALNHADRVFSVSDSLRRHVIGLGIPAEKVRVVANGVDLEKFHPLPRDQCRQKLGLTADQRVLISVGGLVERKGFHRVIELLPALIEEYPSLCYLIVGGACAEGNWEPQLREQVRRLGMDAHVRFLGAQPSERLKEVLSAADLFVLATRNEGWANVFLEAMACGLPVVTTNVGGNAEVVNDPGLGQVVSFGDADQLAGAIRQALNTNWDHQYILEYARQNSWNKRVAMLLEEFGEGGGGGMSVQGEAR